MVRLDFDIEQQYPDDSTGGIVLEVEITSGKAVRLMAHVDSGAANCLFQSDYADALGLDLHRGVPLSFAPAGGGSIDAYGHEVTMKVLGQTVNSVVYFTEDPGFRRNVLGRQGWFHHFRVALAVYESRIYLGNL